MDKVEVIRSIMAKRIDVSNLHEDDELSALGLDSLDLVEVVMEIEEALGITFEMEEVASFKTLGDVIRCVNSK